MSEKLRVSRDAQARELMAQSREQYIKMLASRAVNPNYASDPTKFGILQERSITNLPNKYLAKQALYRRNINASLYNSNFNELANRRQIHGQFSFRKIYPQWR